MDLNQSRTVQNLRAAISGESQAALLYEFFARRAEKDGYMELADVFRETSNNEKAHAKIYFDLLSCILATDQNLLHAAESEFHEHSVMYPEFSKIAGEEGFPEIAATFDYVASIESEHEKRFRYCLDLVQRNVFFRRNTVTTWVCGNCGHRAEGVEAPAVCPVCKHPKAYFRQLDSRI